MDQVGEYIGRRIRHYRTKRGMTLGDLAKRIHKSPSAVSKYEHGAVSVDVGTLYDIAEVLGIGIELLLYVPDNPKVVHTASGIPAFFSGKSHFFAYLFDGRVNQIIRCAFDILDEVGDHEYGIAMYMNFADYASYQDCETSYRGTIRHYDALTNILLTNRENPIEQASVQILASYLDAETKWGLFNGLSSRPMMPVATKMLLSTTRLKETPELIRDLMISKNDIRMLKLYNMLCVV